MLRSTRRNVLKALGLAAVLPHAAHAQQEPQLVVSPKRIAMVVKSQGVKYFEACRTGGQQAVTEAGNAELLFGAPFNPTVREQITALDGVIAQKPDAIVISAVDAQALLPACRVAFSRGIRVISFDSPVAPDGRLFHLGPTSSEQVGAACVQLMAKSLKKSGEVAILSAGMQSENQNGWIEAMRREWDKADYVDMPLITTVYGDDVPEKAKAEATALIKSYPNLKGIIAPTTTGIVAAANAVAETGTAGKIFVTGIGLPSEMKGAVLADICNSFVGWNPIDLGYAAVHMALALVRGEARGAAGTSIAAGRLGPIAIDGDGVATLGDPLVFDRSNIERFADVF